MKSSATGDVTCDSDVRCITSRLLTAVLHPFTMKLRSAGSGLSDQTRSSRQKPACLMKDYSQDPPNLASTLDSLKPASLPRLEFPTLISPSPSATGCAPFVQNVTVSRCREGGLRRFGFRRRGVIEFVNLKTRSSRRAAVLVNKLNNYRESKTV